MQFSNEIAEGVEELSAVFFNPEMEEADSSETSVLTTTTKSVLFLLTPPWEPHPSPNFQTCLRLLSYLCFEYFFSPSTVFWLSVTKQKRNKYGILVRNLEGKRQLGRPRCRCKYNIKTDLKEIKWEGVNWSYLTEDRDNWQAV